MEFYLELIRTVFQAVDDEGKLRNRIVAFTSSRSGEGVSYVVNTLAKDIASLTDKRVLAVDAAGLQDFRAIDPNQLALHCTETHIDNLMTLTADDLPVFPRDPKAGSWLTDPDFRAACLKALRWNYDYVLIDCPSLRDSADATILAPVVDGVSIVVEAGQTRREQISRAQKLIEQAGGTFLGFVLNQRSYPIPGWLYRRL